MYIIFGEHQAQTVDSRYTVLELDTVRLNTGATPVTAYCVVETIPIPDLPKAESLKDMHHNLMVEYRKRDWNYCEQAIGHLMGAWNGELDTFYVTLLNRINNYKDNDPGESWDPVIEKNVGNTQLES